MKTLVIGNTGFIGKCMTKKLINNGYDVVGMDVNTPDDKESSYRFIHGDILNPGDIMKAANGADAIINLAAKHHDFGISEQEFFAVNVQGTQNVLDCANRLGIKKLIFFSTVAVYGNQKGHSTEKTPPEPVSIYGKTKLKAEKLVHDWVAQDNSRQAAILRPAVVFGPDNYANMHKLIDSIYKKRFFFVGKGDNVKSVAYVENLVDAAIYLLEHLKPGIDVYNYSDYPQLSIKETVGVITECLSCDVPKLTLPLRPAIVMTSVFDLLGKLTGYNFPITAFRIRKFNTSTRFESEKIRSDGFKQKVDLSEGFNQMTGWYLKNVQSRHQGAV